MANGWMAEDTLLEMIAVSESTPGPIAINMATFIGSSQYGLAGAILATLGVVTPAFLIMLLIASLMRGMMKYKAVQSFLSGVRPCVVGLILGTACILALRVLFSITTISSAFHLDWRSLVILLLLCTTSALYKRIFHKKASVIIMILFSAVQGIVLYGIF